MRACIMFCVFCDFYCVTVPHPPDLMQLSFVAYRVNAVQRILCEIDERVQLTTRGLLHTCVLCMTVHLYEVCAY